jgi:hypothetical protein
LRLGFGGGNWRREILRQRWGDAWGLAAWKVDRVRDDMGVWWCTGVQGSPNREPVGFLNRKNRTGIPVKPTGIPIRGY